MPLTDNDRAAILHFLGEGPTGYWVDKIDSPLLVALFCSIHRNMSMLIDARDRLAIAEARHERYLAILRRAAVVASAGTS